MLRQSLKVLLVDDDKELSAAIKCLLEDAAFEVTTAADGIEGTTLVDTERFDLILTDVRMPRMNGIQFAANVKASLPNNATPIFVMSGQTDNELLKRAMEAGAVSLLPKPFNSDALVRMIRETLSKKAAMSSHRPEIATCFTEGVAEMLRTYFGAAVTVGVTSTPGDITVNSFASATVSLVGNNVSGFLALSFGQGFMSSATSALFPSAEVKLTDSMTCDIAGELANQAAGRVKARLARVGTDVGIGLPQVVLGLGHKIMRKVGGARLRFEIEAGEHKIFAEFGLAGNA